MSNAFSANPAASPNPALPPSPLHRRGREACRRDLPTKRSTGRFSRGSRNSPDEPRRQNNPYLIRRQHLIGLFQPSKRLSSTPVTDPAPRLTRPPHCPGSCHASRALKRRHRTRRPPPHRFSRTLPRFRTGSGNCWDARQPPVQRRRALCLCPGGVPDPGIVGQFTDRRHREGHVRHQARYQCDRSRYETEACRTDTTASSAFMLLSDS